MPAIGVGHALNVFLTPATVHGASLLKAAFTLLLIWQSILMVTAGTGTTVSTLCPSVWIAPGLTPAGSVCKTLSAAGVGILTTRPWGGASLEITLVLGDTLHVTEL